MSTVGNDQFEVVFPSTEEEEEEEGEEPNRTNSNNHVCIATKTVPISDYETYTLITLLLEQATFKHQTLILVNNE